MKDLEQKKDGKFKKIVKSKVGIGIICFLVGGATMSGTDEIEKLKKELEASNQSIETFSKELEKQIATTESKDVEIKKLQDKIDNEKFWFEMSEEDREIEKKRIIQEKKQKEELKTIEQSQNNNINNITTSNTSQATQESTGGNLVISVTGKKYHRSNCRTVKQVKQSVTASQAQSMGYTACKVCSP